MNKHGYSTNTTGVAVAPIQSKIDNLFSKIPPFNIKSGLTHSVLSKNITVEKGGRSGFTVHVYKKDGAMEEITGSPFKTFGEAHLAIGLKPGSREIGRNIDTVKFFKGLYLFTSLPIKKNKSIEI
uniref:LAGLIDADG endonuclease n=1 Tax=Ramaria rubella TaxID=113071 RepID=UPI00223776E5|nr:LAGLIDADG endonuclease [Ramaria rubella]UYR22251.1 LAGLIDADG endonuclease [Ramaria rubella]